MKSECPLLRGSCGCLCCLAGIGSLVGSIPLFLQASPDLEIATLLSNYNETFEQFPALCQIISIRKCWHSTSDDQVPSVPDSARDPNGAPHCWTAYRARFTPGELNGNERVYVNWPEYSLNRTGACDDGCDDAAVDYERMPSGEIVSGTSTPCWRPTGGTVDRRYRCGNAPCYKLSDPRLLVEPAIEAAAHYLYLAGAVAISGLVLSCVSFIVSPPSDWRAGKPNAELTVEIEKLEDTVSMTRRPWNEASNNEVHAAEKSPLKLTLDQQQRV